MKSISTLLKIELFINFVLFVIVGTSLFYSLEHFLAIVTVTGISYSGAPFSAYMQFDWGYVLPVLSLFFVVSILIYGLSKIRNKRVELEEARDDEEFYNHKFCKVFIEKEKQDMVTRTVGNSFSQCGTYVKEEFVSFEFNEIKLVKKRVLNDCYSNQWKYQALINGEEYQIHKKLLERLYFVLNKSYVSKRKNSDANKRPLIKKEQNEVLKRYMES